MNPTHVHLLITHLPIYGSVLGAVVLFIGLWRRSMTTKYAAYTLFIISAAGAGIAYLTGEEAEETVEHLQGISKQAIEQHSEFASIALTGMIALAILSLLALYFNSKKFSLARPINWFILFISLVCFGLVARTGYLGGLIRHTEITSNAPELHHEVHE